MDKDLGRIYRQFEDDPKRLRTIMEGIRDTVQASFIVYSCNNITKSEINRRMDIAAKWFWVLWKEYQWAYVRCLDELPKAVGSELAGVKYEPSRADKNSWGADNARDLIWLPN